MPWPPPDKPECPHCGSQDTELQVSSKTKEAYLCNGCSKLFEIVKEKRWEGAEWRKGRR